MLPSKWSSRSFATKSSQFQWLKVRIIRVTAGVCAIAGSAAVLVDEFDAGKV